MRQGSVEFACFPPPDEALFARFFKCPSLPLHLFLSIHLFFARRRRVNCLGCQSILSPAYPHVVSIHEALLAQGEQKPPVTAFDGDQIAEEGLGDNLPPGYYGSPYFVDSLMVSAGNHSLGLVSSSHSPAVPLPVFFVTGHWIRNNEALLWLDISSKQSHANQSRFGSQSKLPLGATGLYCFQSPWIHPLQENLRYTWTMLVPYQRQRSQYHWRYHSC